MSSRRLYTWYDVNLVLRQAVDEDRWPSSWVNMDVSPAQVSIEVQLSSFLGSDDSWRDLESFFPNRVDRERSVIVLDSLPGQERLLPVHFEYVYGIGQPLRPPRPLFGGPRFRQTGDMPSSEDNSQPHIVAFYSFKGGVGRTLSLLGLAGVLAARGLDTSSQPSNLLIVDADFEAPGLTWLARQQGGFHDFSMVDALALVQSTENWQEHALPLIEAQVRAEMLRLPIGGKVTEHFFLPAFRDQGQLLRPPFRLEHLLRAPNRQWIVADFLLALGKHLNVRAVLVDLRAGISELSAPFLLDPRIRRIIVTSTSLQPVQGTQFILQELRRWLISGPSSADPVVLLSMVPTDQKSDVTDDIRERLQRAFPSSDEDAEFERLTVWEVPFVSELVHLGDLEDIQTKLSVSGLGSILERVSTDVVPPEPRPSLADAARDPLSLLSSLGDFCSQMEYAEQGRADTFLRTVPLRNLARKFTVEPPRAVVMGAKGAGKTFTYLQLLREQDWNSFVHKFVPGHRTRRHPVLPLLQPRHLESPARELIASCWRNARTTLGTASSLQPGQIADSLMTAVAQKRLQDEVQWRDYWLQLMAEAAGVQDGGDGPLPALQRFLTQQDLFLTFVFDGLEDCFQRAHESLEEQAALRGLCTGALESLADLPNRRIGVVVFLRKDLVRAAVRQNTGQFERLHEAYELRWNADEALRLVLWAVQEAGVGSVLEPEAAEADPSTCTRLQLEQYLVPLWGLKLGTDRGNEAYTANWVLSALSDFQGRLQARDLIRFLRHAAQSSAPDPARKTDRLLQIGAIKAAIRPCGEQKVAEIKQEIRALEPVLDRIRNAEEGLRRVPFSPEAFGLLREEVKLLRDQGIAFEEDQLLYTPEIYRQGLGLGLSKGARPRVLTLMRHALASIQR